MTGLGGLPTWRAIWVGKRTTCIGFFSNNGYPEAIQKEAGVWTSWTPPWSAPAYIRLLNDHIYIYVYNYVYIYGRTLPPFL